MRVITFKAPEYLIEELDRISASLGVSRSSLIKTAIIEYINKNGDGVSRITKQKQSSTR